MPTKKIMDLPTPCAHPEHKPPTLQLFENGVYEHTCPACGHRTRFVVARPTL